MYTECTGSAALAPPRLPRPSTFGLRVAGHQAACTSLSTPTFHLPTEAPGFLLLRTRSPRAPLPLTFFQVAPFQAFPDLTYLPQAETGSPCFLVPQPGCICHCPLHKLPVCLCRPLNSQTEGILLIIQPTRSTVPVAVAALGDTRAKEAKGTEKWGPGSQAACSAVNKSDLSLTLSHKSERGVFTEGPRVQSGE